MYITETAYTCALGCRGKGRLVCKLMQLQNPQSSTACGIILRDTAHAAVTLRSDRGTSAHIYTHETESALPLFSVTGPDAAEKDTHLCNII